MALSEIFYVTHTIKTENFLENYEREYKRLDVYAVNCRENPDINFKTWNSETAVYSATFWFHENLAIADTYTSRTNQKEG